MGKALYRKYRPKSLRDVAGQEHITTTLSNAIKSGKISHAYLLTGPRGVGKTSIARILAHELNNIPYEDAAIHLDIVEIDAASNRRIDEVRDLRDKVHILPTSAKYKVYIIDEVHMLTREAFNALLKTLEEPPEHVIFVLATTEAHKLPETIVSRTQHFTFKPIELETIVGHLRTIAKAEKIAIDDAALTLVATHGNGSFRDSISLLDQARSIADKITAQDIEHMLGIAPQTALESLLETIEQGNAKDLFAQLTQLREQGLEAAKLATQLSQQIRAKIIADNAYLTPGINTLLYGLLDVSGSSQAERLLELVLLDYVLSRSPQPSTASVAAVVTTLQPQVDQPASHQHTPKEAPKQPAKTAATAKPTESKTAEPKPTEQKTTEEAPATPSTSANEAHEPFTTESWPVVLATIKKKYNTLYGILRMVEARVEGSTLTLNCSFAFHQKQINESRNRKIIGDVIKQQSGQDIEIVCVVVAKDAKPDEKASSEATLSNVSDIFGTAEVLES